MTKGPKMNDGAILEGEDSDVDNGRNSGIKPGKASCWVEGEVVFWAKEPAGCPLRNCLRTIPFGLFVLLR